MASTDLNSRDLQLLRFMALGLNTKGIAEKMQLSPKTIEYHINGTNNPKSLAAKLHISDRSQLIRMAVERGLVKPGESLPPEKPPSPPMPAPAIEGFNGLLKTAFKVAGEAASGVANPVQVAAFVHAADAAIRVAKLLKENQFEELIKSER